MRALSVAVGLVCVALAAPVLAAEPTAAEKAAVFKAAGFKAKGGKYVRCEDDVTASYMAGFIEWQDLNGDGVDEAFVRESSLFCYGNTAEAVVIVAKDAKGAWAIVLDQVGVALPLKTKTKGWLDIEVGGPGAGPFPRYRYDGKTYVAKK